MLAAGLVAKKAVALGLQTKPWVKTSLAPGSKVVTDYLIDAGLMRPLEQLRFNLVGYGCTTCIGNSGPLLPAVSHAIEEGSLVAAAVLSGNRNFEGRVHAEVRANYLASPPLVVAYALAGRMDIDLETRAAGPGLEGTAGISAATLADAAGGPRGSRALGPFGNVPQELRRRLQGRRALAVATGACRRSVPVGTKLDVCQTPALLRSHDGGPEL